MTWPTTRFATGKEIRAKLIDIQANHPSWCSVADLPEKTVKGKRTNFLRIGRPPSGSTTTRPVAVITGGIHAREWAPPMAITNLAEKLVHAASRRRAITIGGAVTPAADVRAILRHVDLFVAPLINRDGYDFSLRVDPVTPLATRTTRGWRKNRRPAPTSPPTACSGLDSIGVDINRNFDVVWDFTTCYAAGAIVQTSDLPCDDIFFGTAAFSEPEARNVRSLLNHDPSLYIDVHMFGPTILHSWGIEENAPTIFATPVPACGQPRDGTVGAGTTWSEPINFGTLLSAQLLGTNMAAAALLATGTTYPVQQGAALVSISGAADDFAFANSLSTSTTCLSFTVECGTTFLPDFSTEFPDIEREVQAALLAALSALASSAAASAAPTSGGGSGGGPTP